MSDEFEAASVSAIMRHTGLTREAALENFRAVDEAQRKYNSARKSGATEVTISRTALYRLLMGAGASLGIGRSNARRSQRRVAKYEYRTTEGQRKAWDGEPDLSKEGWEEYEPWERFDYTEERYWRRPKPAPALSETPAGPTAPPELENVLAILNSVGYEMAGTRLAAECQGLRVDLDIARWDRDAWKLAAAQVSLSIAGTDVSTPDKFRAAQAKASTDLLARLSEIETAVRALNAADVRMLRDRAKTFTPALEIPMSHLAEKLATLRSFVSGETKTDG